MVQEDIMEDQDLLILAIQKVFAKQKQLTPIQWFAGSLLILKKIKIYSYLKGSLFNVSLHKQKTLTSF